MSQEITTSEYSEALKLHYEILANIDTAAISLVEMCKGLKKMRDQKLYLKLGHESFEIYCEQMAGIKARQAYNYIASLEKLGSDFLQSNANYGITKLELISKLPPGDRVEMAEDGTFEGMSVSELQELVKKSKTQGEQISLLEEELEELKQREGEDDTDEVLAIKQQEIEELKKRLTETEAELEKAQTEKEPENSDAVSISPEQLNEIKEHIKKEAEAAEKQKTKDAIDKAVEKAKKQAEAEADKKAKEAADKAKAEAKAEAQREIELLKNAQAATDAKTKELEKKLKLSDGKSATAAVYFNAMRDDFDKLVETIQTMLPEEKSKFQDAVSKALDILKQKLSEA